MQEQYGQGGGAPMGGGPVGTPPGNGMGVASLVLGIVTLVFAWWTSIFAIIFVITAVVGLVLAISASKKNQEAGFPRGGLVTAGLVLNVIGVIFATISFFACGVCIVCMMAAADPFMW